MITRNTGGEENRLRTGVAAGPAIYYGFYYTPGDGIGASGGGIRTSHQLDSGR
jgi:hypothetical protein